MSSPILTSILKSRYLLRLRQQNLFPELFEEKIILFDRYGKTGCYLMKMKEDFLIHLQRKILCSRIYEAENNFQENHHLKWKKIFFDRQLVTLKIFYSK